MGAQRLVWMDALRLSAGVSMVALHATADANGQPFPDWPVEDRLIPLLIRAVVYIARTELFIIISIFLLLMALEARPRGYGPTIRQQVRRLLVPFAFWTVFYAFYSLIKATQFGYAPALWDALGQPMTWVEYFVLGTSKYHMHFLPTLFGLVLMFPLYRIARDHVWLGLLVVACLMIKREMDVFLWSSMADMPGFDFVLRAVKIVTYAGYGFVAAALLGLWQRHGPVGREADDPSVPREDRLAPWVPVVAFAGGLLFLLKLAAVWQTLALGRWPHNFTPGYWADFLMPVALFALCMCLAGRHWPPVIGRVAKYSFGIYLCHPIFLDLIEISIAHALLTPTAQVLIKIGLAVPLTTALVIGLSRIPALAWTVGLGPIRLPWLAARAVGWPPATTSTPGPETLGETLSEKAK
ncbi:MAG: acyltransferase [Pseudomonadota bacterium]